MSEASCSTTKKEDLLDVFAHEDDQDKEEFTMTVSELDQIKKALKDKEFRKLLSDYVEEIRDPENQLLCQSELRQLEKERGNVIHFINPVAGYVLKTSVNGSMKAFVNICTNTLIKKPTFEAAVKENKRGNIWSIPYVQSPGRDDFDKEGQKCAVYDVIFHPDALDLAKNTQRLQQTLEQTAIDAIEKSFNVVLDKNNIRKPKLSYKGLKTAVTIKYKIGENPPTILEIDQLCQESPPQRDEELSVKSKEKGRSPKTEPQKAVDKENDINLGQSTETSDESTIMATRKCTEPKYSIKYRSLLDIQNFCLDNQMEGKGHKPRPDELILTIELPMLSDSKDLDVDVVEDGWYFELKSEKKTLYRLKLKLPFRVDDEKSKAKFAKDKRKLVVTMKIIPAPSVSPLTVTEKEYAVFPEGKEKWAEEEHEVIYRNVTTPLDIPSKTPLRQTILSVSGDSTDIGSPGVKKTVRFSDSVQEQVYRVNSSILGQRKKNQRKAKNKRRARERLNSGESVSSMDDEDDGHDRNSRNVARDRFNSGGSLSSMDDEEHDQSGTDKPREEGLWEGGGTQAEIHPLLI